jgi:hypothetical protein
MAGIDPVTMFLAQQQQSGQKNPLDPSQALLAHALMQGNQTPVGSGPGAGLYAGMADIGNSAMLAMALKKLRDQQASEQLSLQSMQNQPTGGGYTQSMPMPPSGGTS